MPLLRKTPEMGAQFRRNETVAATEDLPGVPAGTEGKVKLINGFSWIRYWVFFDNGVELGSLDNEQLVRPRHWDDFIQQREARVQAEAEAAERAASGESAAAAGGGDDAAAIDPNDPMAALLAQVPPHLIERSAAARVRLGTPKP